MKRRVLMQGNEACIEGAIKAGMKFFAGYPITPSTEIAELASIRLPSVNGRFIQMEDEISSMAAIIGASACGMKSMTATSGPGFSLKQENIGYASMTEIPCVIVNVMRGGPSTGLPTSVGQGDIMQSRWGTHGDHPIIVLAPSNVEEIYKLTIRAFNLSESYRVPVVLLLDEVNAHMREVVELDDSVEIVNRKRAQSLEEFIPYGETQDGVPEFADFGEGFKYHITGLCHDQRGNPSNNPDIAEKLIKRLIGKIEGNKKDICFYNEVNIEECKDLVIACGSTARVVMEIIHNQERGIGLFMPYTIWPFPEDRLLSIIDSGKIDRIFVPELNAGQLVYEIERIVKDKCKVFSINKFNGELFTPDEILEEIRRV